MAGLAGPDKIRYVFPVPSKYSIRAENRHLQDGQRRPLSQRSSTKVPTILMFQYCRIRVGRMNGTEYSVRANPLL